MNSNKQFKIIAYLLLLTILNFSCVQEKPSETKVNTLESNKRNLYFLPPNETSNKLKYTSGIRAILHDSKGNYWLGSHQEGACLFDGKIFTYFTIEDGLNDNQVRTIQEDENGVIWFGTANGVSSYEKGIIKNHTQKNVFTGHEPATKGTWALTNKDLWFNGGHQSGVYRFDGQKMSYLAFPIQGDNNGFNKLATGFSKGKNTIWIASYTAVFGYDGKSFTIIDDDFLGFTKESEMLHVRSILEDSKGNVWIGNNGIGVLLKNEDTIINFSEKNALIHANSSGGGALSPSGTLEHVFAIGEDKKGNIWFGDRDTGAWKYDGKSMKNYTIDDQLATQHIWQIYQDRNDELLFAMGNGGVYKFNDKSFEQKY